MQINLNELGVKLFADGADLKGMIEMASKPYISGLTTNPTLMKKAGITDYVKFAKEVLREIPDKPISFEVFSDDLNEMKAHGEKISSWGSNVNVKIPITNTKGEFTGEVVKHLTALGVRVNVTAIMTSTQVEQIIPSLNSKVGSYISVFAGRIADTGRDPLPIMKDCLNLLDKDANNAELIWASPRELLNVFQASQIRCHIITATNDILKKLDLVGYDLSEFSLDTVKMFHQDAVDCGFHV
jgi:transaldolase